MSTTEDFVKCTICTICTICKKKVHPSFEYEGVCKNCIANVIKYNIGPICRQNGCHKYCIEVEMKMFPNKKLSISDFLCYGCGSNLNYSHGICANHRILCSICDKYYCKISYLRHVQPTDCICGFNDTICAFDKKTCVNCNHICHIAHEGYFNVRYWEWRCRNDIVHLCCSCLLQTNKSVKLSDKLHNLAHHLCDCGKYICSDEFEHLCFNCSKPAHLFFPEIQVNCSICVTWQKKYICLRVLSIKRKFILNYYCYHYSITIFFVGISLI